MIKNILSTIDRSFDPGNYENFRLNEFLLIINTFLLFVTLLVIMEDFGWIEIYKNTRHNIHVIELGFGIFFLAEFILRTIYTYIPDKKLFTLYPLINILVILSLLMPGLFNLAFLRIVISLKMLKLYHMRREGQRQLAQNPDFITRETVVEKVAHPLERAVDTVSDTAGKAASSVARGATKKIVRNQNQKS